MSDAAFWPRKMAWPTKNEAKAHTSPTTSVAANTTIAFADEHRERLGVADSVALMEPVAYSEDDDEDADHADRDLRDGEALRG